jgi:hypothetical protein
MAQPLPSGPGVNFKSPIKFKRENIPIPKLPEIPANIGANVGNTLKADLPAIPEVPKLPGIGAAPALPGGVDPCSSAEYLKNKLKNMPLVGNMSLSDLTPNIDLDNLTVPKIPTMKEIGNKIGDGIKGIGDDISGAIKDIGDDVTGALEGLKPSNLLPNIKKELGKVGRIALAGAIEDKMLDVLGPVKAGIGNRIKRSIKTNLMMAGIDEVANIISGEPNIFDPCAGKDKLQANAAEGLGAAEMGKMQKGMNDAVKANTIKIAGSSNKKARDLQNPFLKPSLPKIGNLPALPGGDPAKHAKAVKDNDAVVAEVAEKSVEEVAKKTGESALANEDRVNKRKEAPEGETGTGPQFAKMSPDRGNEREAFVVKIIKSLQPVFAARVYYNLSFYGRSEDFSSSAKSAKKGFSRSKPKPPSITGRSQKALDAIIAVAEETVCDLYGEMLLKFAQVDLENIDPNFLKLPEWKKSTVINENSGATLHGLVKKHLDMHRKGGAGYLYGGMHQTVETYGKPAGYMNPYKVYRQDIEEYFCRYIAYKPKRDDPEPGDYRDLSRVFSKLPESQISSDIVTGEPLGENWDMSRSFWVPDGTYSYDGERKIDITNPVIHFENTIKTSSFAKLVGKEKEAIVKHIMFKNHADSGKFLDFAPGHFTVSNSIMGNEANKIMTIITVQDPLTNKTFAGPIPVLIAMRDSKVYAIVPLEMASKYNLAWAGFNWKKHERGGWPVSMFDEPGGWK